jgi:hypothetical protein
MSIYRDRSRTWCPSLPKTVGNKNHLGGSSLVSASPGTLNYLFLKGIIHWLPRMKLITYKACKKTMRADSGTAEDARIMQRANMLTKTRSILDYAY